jgi:hypothetical protein
MIFSLFLVPVAEDINMTNNPLQSLPHAPGGDRPFAPPRRHGREDLNLVAFLLGQQFGKCIAGRKDRGPAVMHLTGLLPGV